MAVKQIAGSNINQAALVIGGLAAYRTIKTFIDNDGVMPELNEEEIMNIITFFGAAVVFIKRTWYENAPIQWRGKNPDSVEEEPKNE